MVGLKQLCEVQITKQTKAKSWSIFLLPSIGWLYRTCIIHYSVLLSAHTWNYITGVNNKLLLFSLWLLLLGGLSAGWSVCYIYIMCMFTVLLTCSNLFCTCTYVLVPGCAWYQWHNAESVYTLSTTFGPSYVYYFYYYKCTWTNWFIITKLDMEFQFIVLTLQGNRSIPFHPIAGMSISTT